MTPERTRLRADVVVAGKQRETGPRVPHTVLNVDLNEADYINAWLPSPE